MDVHEIYRTDTGECVCRMVATEDTHGETLYERCIEKLYPDVTIENDAEMLEYCFVTDVDPETFEEIRI